jgi:regulatory protein
VSEVETRCITAIEPQLRHPERRSIFLDGEFALGVDGEVIARAALRVGQELSLAQLQEVARIEERRVARDAALAVLGHRDRSAREIERRLLRKGFEPEVVAEVMEQLERHELVDDRRFARAWVAGHTGSRPYGPDRLAAALRARGVDREAIDEAVGTIDPDTELDLALRAGQKLIAGRPVAPDTRRRLAAALRRRGYSWEIIRPVCDQLLSDAAESET